ncbi:class I SAM-dependent methyltransferase [Pseudomonas mosselii]|uniref:class I SAM-dependent methyltransferase n=1 Tax=Pseudomonas mosselii TaxID=78327 RepID=UPI000D92D416|nr:class I SAM-dependent methyltransferase [Pseudomonas mosselii]PYC16940.1 hypothetical protein DMX06_19260 [Pseudomonas mosselii]
MVLTIPGTLDDIAGHLDLEASHPFFGSVRDADHFAMTAMLPNLPPARGPLRILDFGGGQGLLLERCMKALAEQGVACDALLVDANPGFVASARARGIEAVVSDLSHYEGEPADIILMRLVLHYNDEVAQQAMIANVHKHLRPDGLFILQYETSPALGCELRNRVALLCAEATKMSARYWASTEVLMAWLHNAGFAQMFDVAQHHYESDVVALLRNAWQRQAAVLVSNELSEETFHRACADMVFDCYSRAGGNDLYRKEGRLTLRTSYPIVCARQSASAAAPPSGGSSDDQ